MNKGEKQANIERYEETLKGLGYAILTEFGKMPVGDSQDFRKELRTVGSNCLVLKNTLARIVFERQGYEEVTEHLVGPSMLIFGNEEIAPAAKVLNKFQRNFPALKPKLILCEGKLYPREEFKSFTTMPTRDEVRAKFLSLLKAPVNQFVCVINVPQRFASLLGAFAGKRNES